MGSRESAVLRFVLWLISRYLSDKYRLMTPEQLNQVVENYLAELPKLGLKIVMESQLGENHDKVDDSDRTEETSV